MSETTKEKCNICGDIVEEDIVHHLRQEHEDQPDQIDSSYRQQIVDEVFDQSETPQEADESGETDESTEETPNLCRICGEQIVDSKGEMSFQQLVEHLQTVHSDLERIREEYPEQADLLEPRINSAEPDASAESVEQSDGRSDRRSVSRVSAEMDVGRRGKFSVFGVGGAGNNILDAMILRRDTLETRDKNLTAAWRGGMQTYLPLNTNDQEVYDTYFVQQDQKLSRDDAERICSIGVETPHGGAGEEPHPAYVWMKNDVSGAPRTTFDRWPFNPEDVNRAQALLFLHSVVKGTGSGASPTLAKYLRQQIIDTNTQYDMPLVAMTVLPKDTDLRFKSGRTENCGFGFGWMASNVDLIIPFDNGRLEIIADDIRADVDGLDEWNPAYATVNRPLVKFIEAYMLTSNDRFIDAEATEEIDAAGVDNGFDVPDSFRPVSRRYPKDQIEDVKPGVVGAPVFGRADSRRIDEVNINTLISSTLRHGRMVDFEPSTAWGGVFIFYGPRESMEDIATLSNRGVLTETFAENLGETDMHLSLQQAVVSELDKLHLWGLMWNPEMPSLRNMYEKAQEAKERNDERGEFFTEVWDEVEPVYNFLGKENRS